MLNVRVGGQLAFNSSVPILSATLAGRGVAYIPEDMAAAYIAEGRLLRVLTTWCPAFTGYYFTIPRASNRRPRFNCS